MDVAAPATDNAGVMSGLRDTAERYPSLKPDVMSPSSDSIPCGCLRHDSVDVITMLVVGQKRPTSCLDSAHTSIRLMCITFAVLPRDILTRCVAWHRRRSCMPAYHAWCHMGPALPKHCAFASEARTQ